MRMKMIQYKRKRCVNEEEQKNEESLEEDSDSNDEFI